MSDDHEDDSAVNPPRKPKRPSQAKTPNRYADAPYEVGKGKPPIASRFQAGNKGGGRKPGSRTRTPYDRLLKEKVQVGEDRLGKPIMKTFEEVIDRQLLRKAAAGDLRAIKIEREFRLKLAELERRYGPPPKSPEQMLRDAAEEAEKKKLSEKLSREMVGWLEISSELKRHRLLDFVNGVPVLNDRAAAILRRHEGDDGGLPEAA